VSERERERERERGRVTVFFVIVYCCHIPFVGANYINNIFPSLALLKRNNLHQSYKNVFFFFFTVNIDRKARVFIPSLIFSTQASAHRGEAPHSVASNLTLG
jgi:hypothetical protein